MRHTGTIVSSEADSSLIMNKDATPFDFTGRSSSRCDQVRPAEGVMPFAYVLLGAVAFPLVLATAMASGLGLVAAGLAAFALSGPVAFVVYLALALATSRGA